LTDWYVANQTKDQQRIWHSLYTTWYPMFS
jgi:hypothetical protein